MKGKGAEGDEAKTEEEESQISIPIPKLRLGSSEWMDLDRNLSLKN